MTHPELTNASKELLKKFDLKLHTAWSDTHNKDIWRKLINYNINKIINNKKNK
jgi:hypothetical protein